ncbi:MAG: phosphate transport regulator, partial [Aquabacterium sp.]
QDHIKALAMARTLSAESDASDTDAFLSTTWAVLHAEKRCDELLRQARRTLLHAIDDAPSLMLANDLACTLELASDRLLTAAYSLRDVVLSQAEVRP